MRWLKITALVRVIDGEVPKLKLFYGRPNLSKTDLDLHSARKAIPKSVHIDDKEIISTPNSNRYQRKFKIVVRGQDDTVYRNLYCTDLKEVISQTNNSNQVRNVYRTSLVRGNYVDEDGTHIASCEIRTVQYLGIGISRIYHTLTWNLNKKSGIQLLSLDFLINDNGSARVRLNNGQINTLRRSNDYLIQYIDSVQADPPIYIIDPWDEPEFINWAEYNDGENKILATRWSKENYPNGFARDENGNFVVRLLGYPNKVSSRPLEFSQLGLIIPELITEETIIEHENPLSIQWNTVRTQGISKTHEIVITDKDKVAPHIAYDFVDKPLFYLADRKIMSVSKQPVFWTPAHSQPAVSNPDITSIFEKAIKNSLEFMRNKITSSDSARLGWVYHGARHYDLNSLVTREQFGFRSPDRFWLNHDGGAANTSWIQWLRTGNRKDLEFAEINSRHLMDLATTNVDITRQGNERIRAGAQHHPAIAPYGNAENNFTGFNAEADYLLSYCYLLSYDRACDFLIRRQEMWCSYEHRDPYIIHTPVNERPVGARGVNTRDLVAHLMELLQHVRDPFITCAEERGNNVLKERIDVIIDHLIRLDVFKHTHLTEYLIDIKLATAADYNREYQDKIRKILTKIYDYYRYYGDSWETGISAENLAANKPFTTLFTARSPLLPLNKFVLAKDSNVNIAGLAYQRAVSLAYGHAITVNTDPVGAWLGSSITNFYWLGGDVRGWIMLSAYLDTYPFEQLKVAAPANVMGFEFDESSDPINHRESYTRCETGSLTVEAARFNSLGRNSTVTIEGFGISPITGVLPRDYQGGCLPENDNTPGRDCRLPDNYGRFTSTFACEIGEDYKITIDFPEKANTSYGIRSSSSKLVHVLHENIIRASSFNSGGTVWVKIHEIKKNDGSPVVFRVSMRDLANSGSKAGKLVVSPFVVKNSNTSGSVVNEEKCFSKIVGLTSLQQSLQSDCKGVIENNSLIGITMPIRYRDIAKGSVVLKKDISTNENTAVRVTDIKYPKHFVPCFSYTASEYFEPLDGACEPLE